MGTEIIAFILSNPWRSACIGLALVLALSGVAYHIQGLRLNVAQSELRAAEAALAAYADMSKQAEAKAAQAETERKALQKRHAELKKKLDDIVKVWPEECDLAADEALKWFIGRKK